MPGTIATLERFELGDYLGRSVPHLKIAAISKKETYSKLGENVAVNRANVLATDDEREARAWLLGGVTQSGRAAIEPGAYVLSECVLPLAARPGLDRDEFIPSF